MGFFVWVNEEDHMRIVSMEKGDDIKAIFTRFANATEAIQKCCKEEGYDFMHNEHLGFILTCPSNLGTGPCWCHGQSSALLRPRGLQGLPQEDEASGPWYRWCRLRVHRRHLGYLQ